MTSSQNENKAKSTTARKAPARRKKAAPAKPKHPLMLDDKEWDKEKVVEIVCTQLYSTSLSLRKILSAGVSIEGKTVSLPSKATFLKWMHDDEANKTDDDRLSGKATISDHYARARELQVENFYDDLLESVDNAKEPLVTPEGVPVFDSNGQPFMVLSKTGVAAAKLDSDNKKWAMERMRPKKYGARVNADHTHNAGKSLQDLLLEVAKNG